MTLVHMNCRSWCLGTNTDVEIILPSIKNGMDPKAYYQSNKKYPVLWLLHGTMGCYNDYLRRTNIELYATENDLIVVMPSAANSNYSNWTNIWPQFNMFDYLTEELMPMIYGWFPASEKKEDNFIAGLSMGARGASKYGLYWPDRFAGVACMSGVPCDIHYILEQGPENLYYDREKKTIELNGSLENYLTSPDNTWGRLEQVAKMIDSPKFYFCMGTEDPLFGNYIYFKNYAKKIGLNAKFDEREGYAHEWRFWELEIQEILKYFGFKKGFKESLERAKVNDHTLV